MKDKFKKEFGANLEDFFDDEMTTERKNEVVKPEHNADLESTYRMSEDEGDDEFLKSLL